MSTNVFPPVYLYIWDRGTAPALFHVHSNVIGPLLVTMPASFALYVEYRPV